jgi:DNA-binding MarR family transcriptional regulator
VKSTKTYQPDEWTIFVLSIFKLNGLIMQVGESIARPVGQSSARWQVLGRAFEPQTVAQMAKDMGQARQSVQRIADVLAREGLVIYAVHPTDRRTKLVELTPQGLAALSAIYERQVAWTRHITTQLDAKKLATLASELQAIGQVLEADIDH